MHRRIPIAGRTRDRDGTEVEVLLHTHDGYLSGLETYRVGWAPFATPEPDSVAVRLPEDAVDGY